MVHRLVRLAPQARPLGGGGKLSAEWHISSRLSFSLTDQLSPGRQSQATLGMAFPPRTCTSELAGLRSVRRLDLLPARFVAPAALAAARVPTSRFSATSPE